MREPAVLFGDGQPLDAEGTAFLPGFVIENCVAIVRDYVVIQLFAGEAVYRAQQLSLLPVPFAAGVPPGALSGHSRGALRSGQADAMRTSPLMPSYGS